MDEKKFPLWDTDVMFGSRERMEGVWRKELSRAERRAAEQDRKKRYKNCRWCWRAYLKRYDPNCPTVVSNLMNWDTPMPCDRPIINVSTGEKYG